MNAFDIRDETTEDDSEYSKMYDDMLDGYYEDYNVGRICFTASQVLKECDPIAYRCGFNDWIDEIDKPWQCGQCDTRHETEEEAEECCQEGDNK